MLNFLKQKVRIAKRKMRKFLGLYFDRFSRLDGIVRRYSFYFSTRTDSHAHISLFTC